MEVVLTAATLLGGIAAVWYFWDKIVGWWCNERPSVKRAGATAEAEKAEQLRRRQLLAQLRQQYLLSHDGITPELASGLAPLPKEWIEEQLQKLGESWRQNEYF